MTFDSSEKCFIIYMKLIFIFMFNKIFKKLILNSKKMLKKKVVLEVNQINSNKINNKNNKIYDELFYIFSYIDYSIFIYY